jgi:hypothetical protein
LKREASEAIRRPLSALTSPGSLVGKIDDLARPLDVQIFLHLVGTTELGLLKALPTQRELLVRGKPAFLDGRIQYT